MVIILLELGWLFLSFSILSLLSVGLLFEHPARHVTTLVVIVIVVACIGYSSSSSLVFSLPVWVCQHLACTSHVTNYYRVYGGAETQCNVLCSTGKPGKHWSMAHQSECGLPSAVTLNCLVSPSNRESRSYPQSSLYIQYAYYLHWPSIQPVYPNVYLTIITLGTARSTV